MTIRYVPVAEYDIGLCHWGLIVPFKTVTVKADSKYEAMETGCKLLNPSTVQHICHIATRPNHEHMEYNARIEEYLHKV